MQQACHWKDRSTRFPGGLVLTHALHESRSNRFDRPNLINDLISSTEHSLKLFVDSGGNNQAGTLALRRSLEAINAVLKELSSVRMPNGLRTMGKVQCSSSSVKLSWGNRLHRLLKTGTKL